MPPSSPLKISTDDADRTLREALKRCSPATYEAARQFRRTRNTVYLPPLLLGVLEHYVEPDRRALLGVARAELRLIEDLGLDSLTMMEMVILLEDVLLVTLSDEHLPQLRTLGEISAWIEQAVQTAPGEHAAATGAPAAAVG